MQIFARDRQSGKAAEDRAAQIGELRRIIGADIEGRPARLARERIEPHREHDQLAGAARRLEQAARIGVEARRAIAVDLADVIDIAVIVCPAIVAGIDLRRREATRLDPAQHRLGIVAQVDPEMVDQAQAAVGADRAVERKLGEGRAALDQRAARIVADPADHRGAEAGGADHRMRLAPQRQQDALQRVERGARQAHHLRTVPHDMHAGQPAGADDHDPAGIIVAVGGRAAGEPGVRRLEDDRDARRDTGLRHPPLLDQAARPHHRDRGAGTGAVAGAIARGGAGIGQHMPAADDRAEGGDQRRFSLGHSLLRQMPELRGLRRLGAKRLGTHPSCTYGLT